MKIMKKLALPTIFLLALTGCAGAPTKEDMCASVAAAGALWPEERYDTGPDSFTDRQEVVDHLMDAQTVAAELDLDTENKLLKSMILDIDEGGTLSSTDYWLASQTFVTFEEECRFA